MEIHTGLSKSLRLKNPVITTGTFDGVHIGHRKIIENLRTIADDCNGETVLVTFDPHPRIVLFPDSSHLKLITTLDEKQELLEKAGIDHLVIIPFTKEFSRITSYDWVNTILVKQLGVHSLVIGYDHHFGRNREGGINELQQFSKELNFDLIEIPAQDIDDINVSSTKIREALKDGDVKTANTFLTYPYGFTGEVIHGDKRGKDIGFPTANLKINDPLKLVPGDGVYAVNLTIDNNSFHGMLNIGLRPTVDGKKHAVEVHIFDLEQDLYGKEIKVNLMSRIRSEIKFENIEALKVQLEEDAKVARLELSAV